MYRSILIPTDGSELSAKAIHQGAELAKALGARVTGLYVEPVFHAAMFEDFTPMYDKDKVRYHASMKKTATKYLAAVEAAARAAGVAWECVTRESDYPHEAIIKVADELRVELVVMASHGRKGIAGLLLGSETQKVLTHCKVPVLVVR
jgi:nucleotide-binding universal stress UspA family protein